MLTVGSLFTGVGGFDLGLERAGMRVLWQCEQDEFCRRVLAKHWPGVPCYGDVRALRGSELAPVDVICGGFPCQDISLAGAGAGIDGARSGLWAEYARLVGELRPRYVLVENVAALLGRGLGRVLGDLSAFGYDAEWDCIPASAIGAPHRRDRLWLVAYPNADCGRLKIGRERDSRAARSGLEASQRDDADRLRSDVADASRAGLGGTGVRGRSAGGCAGLSDAEGERRAALGPRRAVEAGADDHPRADGGHWLVEPDVGRVADGVPARVDRLRSLGNALVPQIAQWIGERIVRWEGA